jgi:hypothetical protein
MSYNENYKNYQNDDINNPAILKCFVDKVLFPIHLIFQLLISFNVCITDEGMASNEVPAVLLSSITKNGTG